MTVGGDLLCPRQHAMENGRFASPEIAFMPASVTSPRVALFVTCLVDLIRPSVGFAAVKLLEAAGCSVEVPTNQTCCGQPAYNSGDRRTAQALARQTIEACDACDYVVAPSGSCAGMLKAHYPELLADDPAWRDRAVAFGGKVHELMSFLVDVQGLTGVRQTLTARATYHDSCSGLRELGIKDQPRKLLASVEGLEVVEMADCEVCCGFGGTFSVKYGDISNAMVEKKCANITETDADLVLAGDLGCLLNMAGKLKRDGAREKARHVAEVLAGELSDPPIGAAD
jgi:L-lactate dehydrogenase complex protein LldE